MLMQENRPSPDAILSRIADQERKSKRGHFRLFFGMAAGVGKTYDMLKTAQERLKEGIDVQIGIIETHGRVETEKMLAAIPIIPRKKMEYKGTIQEEMDLEAILAKRPGLVLIDELAHTNVPGSRHEKRYQDVIEILEAGIDVYSTMNVQHLESRADVVQLITAVNIRETVPDSILDLADQIKLVDITPHELLARLKEGKIYPGRKTEQALQYFFQEGNLNALREIVLRVTADKVERDMRGGFGKRILQSNQTEKLLVAVSHSPFSEKLIRTARRIVEDLEMPWVAVHVDTGAVLNPRDQNQLVKNLNLAEEMGAEIITLHGSDIAETISQYIREHKVVQMILGRPRISQKWWQRPSQFTEELIRKNPDVDIAILHQPKSEKNKSKPSPKFKLDFQYRAILQAVFWVMLTSGLNHFLQDYVGYRSLGFVFLLLIVILSAFLPFTAVLAAAVSSALMWNYFFIPPRFTFAISSLEDVMMLLAYFVIAIVSGFLSYQLRHNQQILKDREERTQALYEILKSMTLVKGTKPLIDLALAKMENLFNCECGVILVGKQSIGKKLDFGKIVLSENDLAVANLSFDQGRMAGWSTDTLPLSGVLCLALKSGESKLGVLVLKPKIDKKLSSEQESLLISIANQIGLVLAKQKFDEDNRDSKLLKASEKLHQTLLHCVSHELRTPLTSIMGAATTLAAQLKLKNHPELLDLNAQVIMASERLNHVFENLLDVTRLEAGAVTLKEEWFDLAELVQYVIDSNKKLLGEHPVLVKSPDIPMYYFGDFNLLAHALANLLLNAANYSPATNPIEVHLQTAGTWQVLEILDSGPGIPQDKVSLLFEKFYRLPGTRAGGMGLGLAISKNLVELHQGKIDVANRAGGGASFKVSLPLQAAPPQIIEELGEK